ncbi:hypothetical protein AB0912_00355 [Streptomyces sp. NPDC007084]|uniref:hypothetical protein n=1 Tax=Streptomyces sp. NPDC007084 TaxID=3154313 RepID=UPI00345188CB
MSTPTDGRPPVEPFPTGPLMPVAAPTDLPSPSGETPAEDAPPPPETEEPLVS